MTRITNRCDGSHSRKSQIDGSYKTPLRQEPLKTTRFTFEITAAGRRVFAANKKARRLSRAFCPVNLLLRTTGVAIRAVDGRHVAKIDRMFELIVENVSAQLDAGFILTEQVVACVAILGDDFAVFTLVLAVMTTEAALRVKVSDIVWVCAPIDFHFREDRTA